VTVAGVSAAMAGMERRMRLKPAISEISFRQPLSGIILIIKTFLPSNGDGAGAQASAGFSHPHP
jgi:hypothetical protein